MKKIKHTKKIQNRLSIFLVLCLLLSFIPTIHGSSSTSTLYSSEAVSSQQGGSSNCYDGVCFEGEVEGNSLMTYENLIKELGITQGSKPSIPRSGYEEIYDKNAEEESKGGIWLKFTDSKYTRNGKPRTYYVMKKPVRKGISWNALHTAGAVYGWDVIDKNTGLPKSSQEKYKNIGDKGTNRDYKANILTINGEKYIVRLLQGKTNYGGDVSNSKFWSGINENCNSEWNRTILPITKGYRFGSSTFNNDYAEQALRDGNTEDYYKRSYKIQSEQYNWFGDLTLGAYQNWNYNNKSYNGLSSSDQGQLNWVQEYEDSSSRRSFRGDGNVTSVAAYSNGNITNKTYNSYGARLVLEPFTSEKPVPVNTELNINKTDPDGKPLKGVKFTINNDSYITDEKGKVTIPIWKYNPGYLSLEEPEQTINGIKYKAKTIPLYRELANCYDGMCFEGEVEGYKLIPYQNMISQTGISGSDTSIDQSIINKYEGAKEINRQYKDELSKGGIYLKFTDNKYKDSNGKPRTFYVSKKPLRREVSYDMLYNKGLIYGWDIINPDGTVKPNMGVPNTYKPFIKEINGTKYIARLLRGRSNYGARIDFKSTIQNNIPYDYKDAPNSEWNRTILPITKGYRFGGSTFNNNYAEQELRDGDTVSYDKRNYKVQSAQYNWFGDLTLGAYYGFYYKDYPKIDNSDNGTGSNGQWNWTQEFIGSSSRAIRGGVSVSGGAAGSGSYGSDSASAGRGWRLVLEPLTTNN